MDGTTCGAGAGPWSCCCCCCCCGGAPLASGCMVVSSGWPCMPGRPCHIVMGARAGASFSSITEELRSVNSNESSLTAPSSRATSAISPSAPPSLTPPSTPCRSISICATASAAVGSWPVWYSVWYSASTMLGVSPPSRTSSSPALMISAIACACGSACTFICAYACMCTLRALTSRSCSTCVWPCLACARCIPTPPHAGSAVMSSDAPCAGVAPCDMHSDPCCQRASIPTWCTCVPVGVPASAVAPCGATASNGRRYVPAVRGELQGAHGERVDCSAQ